MRSRFERTLWAIWHTGPKQRQNAVACPGAVHLRPLDLLDPFSPAPVPCLQITCSVRLPPAHRPRPPAPRPPRRPLPHRPARRRPRRCRLARPARPTCTALTTRAGAIPGAPRPPPRAWPPCPAMSTSFTSASCSQVGLGARDARTAPLGGYRWSRGMQCLAVPDELCASPSPASAFVTGAPCTCAIMSFSMLCRCLAHGKQQRTRPRKALPTWDPS